MTSALKAVSDWEFEQYVQAEVDGEATPDQLAVLEADRVAWRAALAALRREAEEHLERARTIRGEERAQVVADLESEVDRIAAAWARHNNQPPPPSASSRGRQPKREREERAESEPVRDAPVGSPAPATLQLQVSWVPGRVVAWAAGGGEKHVDGERLATLLTAASAPSTGWTRHEPVTMPDGSRADALSIPVGEVLGWLVAAGAGQIPAAGAGQNALEIGASVRWLGRVAIWAVELTAHGAMVPLLRQRKRTSGSARESNGSYSVRWTPALVDSARLTRLAESMPGVVCAFDAKIDARALIRSSLTGMVDAVCRDSARRLELPAPPPRVRTAADVAEAVIARLDGSAFDAPVRIAGEIAGRVEQWARSVTGERERLIVRLDPPDSGNAWHLAVFASGPKGELVSIEHAIVNAGSGRARLEDETARLERMFTPLARPGGHRRGEVILSQDEAWELMTVAGPQLMAAGFDVRVPALSRRKPAPSLRVFVDGAESQVGANQLANVRWSAVFDGVELSAAEIRELAKEARPLIRAGERWVAIDRADLAAAAEALAERANTTELSGAEMLRLALGIEGSPLRGGVDVVGGGWASDLLEAAAEVKSTPVTVAKGFVGELRSYQCEALGWLGFLDQAGLGGCLALDMGLGKTPVMLAHLLAKKGAEPALVIAPPAVVGNWTAEAARFTPELRVVVHHGARRAAPDEIAAEVADADVVITTYGTAVRDVEALEGVSWSRVVLDEAQAIKNPANDTSQQLRRIPAHSRIALTGTPIENGLGDLWAILDFCNPGLVGPRPQFIAKLSNEGTTTKAAAEDALHALNGILVFRRTKAEPIIAAELPDQIDEIDHCAMTPEQIGMYQALLDALVTGTALEEGEKPRQGQILAAITALKQICNHPSAYQRDDQPLAGRSGKLARLEEIVDSVYAADERVLVFTHFAEWGVRLAEYLTERNGIPVACYHGGLSRTARDQIIKEFQEGEGAGALVLSLKAGGTGLNLTAASHVVLYDRWWNPAVEDQARDRAWRIGQTRTVICHRMICPGTVDERVEEVVAGKRRIADLVLPKSSSLADLDTDQLRAALGIRPEALLAEDLLTSSDGATS